MDEESFRLLQCVVDTFQTSESGSKAVMKIIKDCGDSLSIDQKIQLAKNISNQKSEINKIRISWEGKDYF